MNRRHIPGTVFGSKLNYSQECPVNYLCSSLTSNGINDALELAPNHDNKDYDTLFPTEIKTAEKRENERNEQHLYGKQSANGSVSTIASIPFTPKLLGKVEIVVRQL